MLCVGKAVLVLVSTECSIMLPLLMLLALPRDSLGSHIYWSSPQQAIHPDFWEDATSLCVSLDSVSDNRSSSATECSALLTAGWLFLYIESVTESLMDES